jgi:hypothetical protein
MSGDPPYCVLESEDDTWRSLPGEITNDGSSVVSGKTGSSATSQDDILPSEIIIDDSSVVSDRTCSSQNTEAGVSPRGDHDQDMNPSPVDRQETAIGVHGSSQDQESGKPDIGPAQLVPNCPKEDAVASPSQIERSDPTAAPAQENDAREAGSVAVQAPDDRPCTCHANPGLCRSSVHGQARDSEPNGMVSVTVNGRVSHFDPKQRVFQLLVNASREMGLNCHQVRACCDGMVIPYDDLISNWSSRSIRIV